MNLRPEVQAFAEMMEARLRVNDHKGGWQNDSRAVLLARMYANLPELPSLEACVDVANYALMLALPGSYAAPAPSAPADQPSPDKQGQQGDVAPVATLRVTKEEGGSGYEVWLSDGMWSITEPGDYPLALAASHAPTEEPRTDGGEVAEDAVPGKLRHILDEHARGVMAAPTDQRQVREDSQGLGEPGRLSPTPPHLQRAQAEVASWPPERLSDLRLQGSTDGVAASQTAHLSEYEDAVSTGNEGVTGWVGCGECDCIFACHDGKAPCIRKPADGVNAAPALTDERIECIAQEAAVGRAYAIGLDPKTARPPGTRAYRIAFAHALAAELRAFGVAAAPASASNEATTDQLIELAGALEQRRGLAIVENVTALSTGYHEGAFRAGFETACEEIILRLRTEVWDGCLRPVDAPKDGVPGTSKEQQR